MLGGVTLVLKPQPNYKYRNFLGKCQVNFNFFAQKIDRFQRNFSISQKYKLLRLAFKRF